MRKMIILFVAGVFFLVLLGLATQSYDCGDDGGKDFQIEFNFMTSTSEECPGNLSNCEARLPHWDQKIVLGIVTENFPEEKKDQILKVVTRALSEISEATGLLFEHGDTSAANFFVFILNEDLARILDRPDAAAVGFYGSTLIKHSYERGGCSGRLGIANSAENLQPDEFEEIIGAAIFVHGALDGFALQSCVYEEVAGVVGLPNDPPGQPSLFSNGNYEFDQNRFSYSARTLRMLQAVYAITTGKNDDIMDFCEGLPA